MKGGAALTEPARDDSGSPSGSGSIPAPSLRPKKKERDAPNAFSQARVENFARVSPCFCTYFYTGPGTGQGFFFFNIASAARLARSLPSHETCNNGERRCGTTSGRRKRSEKGSHLDLRPAGRSAARLGATPAVSAIGQRDLLGCWLLSHGRCARAASAMAEKPGCQADRAPSALHFYHSGAATAARTCSSSPKTRRGRPSSTCRRSATRFERQRRQEAPARERVRSMQARADDSCRPRPVQPVQTRPAV